jgi:hypothetical protein
MRDFTGPNSKERYKQLEKLVEGHFYVRRLETTSAKLDGAAPAVGPFVPVQRH